MFPSSHPTDYPGPIRSWLAFVRPKTWGVAVAPVVATLALAYAERGVFDLSIASLTLSIAVLMQIITNMENDLGYTERKAETGNRKGLPRATARGWISVRSARFAIALTATLAIANTAFLVWVGGWIFALIGTLSLVAAYGYMGGPKPIAYTPFGEFTVLLFFGFTAVCGTYYLQTHAWSIGMVLLAVALGSIAAAVLAVNNYRDHEHDASIGRRTLAVVLPPSVFCRFFDVLIFAPYALITLMVVSDHTYWPLLLVFLSLPLGMRLPSALRSFQHEALNVVMFGCVRLEMIFSLLFTVGVLFKVFLEHLNITGS